MARPKDSRSPAPARSSDSSRRRRRGDDRRDRDRRDDGRDFRRPSRSLSPERRPRDRGSNYRDCDRERERDRERARARDKERDRDLIRRMEATDARDETFNRSVPRDYRVRDRRRTPDRYAARPRSPGRRRNRSPGSDRSHRSRDDSCDRPRAPREGRADTTRRSSQATPSGDGARPEPDECQKSRAGGSQPEADRKAERLAKLEAWKKKKETESQMQKARHPDERSQTMQLLAEMDRKANMQTFSSPMIDATSATPTTAAVHQPHMAASSTQPYTGKFDPKSIAKKSAAARSHDSAKSVLGSLHVQPSQQLPPTATDRATAASALPANRGKTSGFGFGKAQPVNDKLPNKRKLDLDEEVTVQRTLKKLPALSVDPELEPGHDQDEDYGSGDNIGEDEEAAVAADRAAHEKRLQAENQVDEQADEQAGNQTDEWASDQADNQTDGQAGEQTGEQTGEEDGTTDKNANFIPQETNVDAVQGGDKAPAERTAEQAVTEPMDVDVEEDVDPLDAFMDNLQQTEMRKPAKTTRGATTAKQPETYFSDEDNVFDVGADGDPGNILALANKRKKKDIPTTDYSKIKIEEVRKKFWVEPMELSSMTDTELADLRLELDGIKVKGKDIPKPVQKWAQCGLTGQALEVIGSLGYEKPTSIQMQAIPALMSGRDMVGVAKTGSGKTIAFLIPMFRHIMDQPPIRETDGPIGLIMTPTRELATQIHRDCKPFAKTMGLRAVCAYGGAPVRDQIADLKRGAAIIVCTPGRMIDLLAANQGRVTNLRRVTYVVLDEADRMFDMGFEPQVMKIFANMRPDKQTILFSATMPWLIDSLTKKILKNPIEITVGGRSVVAKEIQQVVEVRDDDTKFLRVLQLLGELYQQDEDARSLIFVDRQEKADDLLKELMVKGYPCMSIHGGKDQIDRDSTISDFKKGIFPVLIATSVAARGLDVKQLKLVINFDAPNHMEDYVHRSGRTGRAGNSGMAVTFVTPQQENCAVGIAKALEQSGQPVPEKLDEMRKAWREKVKSGKAKESSGFGGKGLDRLNDQREAARQVQRRTHRAEGEEEEEKEEKKDADKGEKALDAIKAVASAIHARDNPKVGGPDNKPGAGGTRSSKDPLDKVSSAVSAINSRLGKSGQLRSGQPIDNKGPDAGAFHATLEINDFPQKARWAVTNRTNVAKILESTGTSITTKGNFYPPGKEAPANGDPKLYILIEGETELAVKSAMQEMTRLLTDATNASVEAENRAPASGRYTVT